MWTSGACTAEASARARVSPAVWPARRTAPIIAIPISTPIAFFMKGGLRFSWLVRGPADGAYSPLAGVVGEHHQLSINVLLRITFVVLGARNDPGRVTTIERHPHRAPLGLDLALEVDVRWQMVGFVFGPGFDFSRLHEHGVGRDEAHGCGCVAGGDCPVEGVDDRLDVTLARRWRRRRARREPRQGGDESVVAGS